MSVFPVPPSIAGKVKDRHRSRRERIRIELSAEQGKWLAGLINNSIADMDIDDPEFRAAYQLYQSMTTQLSNITSKE